MIEIGQRVTFYSGLIAETLTGVVKGRDEDFLILSLDNTGSIWSVREDVVTVIDSGGVVELVDTAV
jgi:hypothetical protein